MDYYLVTSPGSMDRTDEIGHETYTPTCPNGPHEDANEYKINQTVEFNVN